ncbi:LppP/LprE family lipoprotein [Mycobacterium sp. 236(2023)]|uniref:LppP/LprE family lipoprotein n=1 Tax=Mycobacterium sp. 236(2023) TaxID=3038163 RepID=UPI0024158D63|nr:LppP/LprE family lipoprotein [Mycobacterium sp. 236(2023)]MDG4667542.1 LppP/LprE family lipoprotein [Mycobacterium sp. 236(2023)]
MRLHTRPVALVLLILGLVVGGCGSSTPEPASTSSAAAADCGPGPSAQDVEAEFALLPPGPWREASRGHAADCQLQWVVVTSGDQPDSAQQVLFFDGPAPVGSPTMEPRPYITVTAQGEHDAVVQYQWKQGQDEPCCPTGIGSARVTLEDGRLTILDPIPNE